MSMERGWNDDWRKDRSNWRITCPNAKLPTANPTRTALDLTHVSAISQRRMVRAMAILCTVTYHQDADKSFARPTSPCIFFYGENISFDASLVIHK